MFIERLKTQVNYNNLYLDVINPYIVTGTYVVT